MFDFERSFKDSDSCILIFYFKLGPIRYLYSAKIYEFEFSAVIQTVIFTIRSQSRTLEKIDLIFL